MLSVATFFEGYDFFALAQVLPAIRAEMGLDPTQTGVLLAVVNAGTMLAALVVRKGDTWGRRRVLTLTIAGYTVCSFLTALAQGPVSFSLLQMLARIFLIGEWAVAMVYAAEEFPADRRGLVIGVIQACSSFGAVACAGLVPLMMKAPTGWRTVYLVGTVPLILVALARRSLQETTRFTQRGPAAAGDFFRIFRGPWRKRMLQMALIWSLAYVCTHNAVTFWKAFAMEERGFTEAQVGLSMTTAALVAMPLVFLWGRLLDRVGRRAGATVTFLITAVGVFLSYRLHSAWALTASLVLGFLGSNATLPVLNAFTAELFPTDLRADAFAWANNLLGRVGYVLSPIAVGVLAESHGWGFAVAITAFFPLVSLGLILALLPETGGRELEATSAV